MNMAAAKSTLPPPTPVSRVTVVIPNWNGARLMHTVCLPSLARQTYRDFYVIVVDNGSTDGSRDYLGDEWPDVQVISLARNYGFAAAVNRGIEASDSEFVALLNNDVEVAPMWLAKLVASIDEHPHAGSVTGKILSFADRTLLQSAGDAMTWDGMFFSRGTGQRDSGQFAAPEPIFSATAGAALYRRTAFDAVGLFDEQFFAYYEDVDWGFRAQLLRLECWYVPDACAYHIGHATSNAVSGFAAYLLTRNGFWVIVKNFPRSVLWRSLPRIVFATTRHSYRAARRTSLRNVLSAWRDATVGMPEVIRKRRSVQSRRRASLADLDRVISPRNLRSEKLDRLQALVKRRAPRRRAAV